MLTKFIFSNYKSYRDTQEFDFVVNASGSKTLIKNTIFKYHEGNKLKRVYNAALVYGANGSGKSNFLEALINLSRLVISRRNEGEHTNENVPYITSNTNITKFEVTFITSFDGSPNVKEGDSAYEFSYKLNFDYINGEYTYESLDYRLIAQNGNISKESKKIFSRSKNTITGYPEVFKSFVDQQKLVDFKHYGFIGMINGVNPDTFSELINSKEFKLISLYAKQWESNILFGELNHMNENYIAKTLKDSPEIHNSLINILNDLDFGIKDIQAKDVTQTAIKKFLQLFENIDTDILNEQDDNPIQNRINQLKKRREYALEFIHENELGKFKLPFSAESRGTQKFIFEFINYSDAIQNGKLYIADELEASYHPIIQDYILKMFLKGDGQLLAITHNPDFMEEDSLSNEQYWFVEKTREDLSSNIYSLSDFPKLNRNINYRNQYLNGRFGATPEVIEND